MRRYGDSPYGMLLSTFVPGLFALGLGYLGQRLWVEAARFGDSGSGDSGGEIPISRTLLLQGVLLAFGIDMAVKGAMYALPFLVRIVAPGPAFNASTSAQSNLIYGIVYVAFAAGLLTWVYRSWNGANADDNEQSET